MKMNTWVGKGVVVLLGLSLWFFNSHLFEKAIAAEKDFPKKEITVIINLGPGGGRDILTRGTAKVWSKHLGVPMVPVNMPGAGGVRGYVTLNHAKPDGYTVGVGGTTQIKEQILGDYDFDMKKFTYIGNVQSDPLFIFVKSDSPFRSVKDFKKFGKPIRHATYSVSASLTPLLISEREDFSVKLVAGFKSTAECVLSILREETEFFYSPLSPALAYVKSGQIRPILTVHKRRSPHFPEIPTVGDVGFGDLAVMSLDSWFMAPPETPKDRIQILEEALDKTLKDPEFVEWANKAGVSLGPMSSKELTSFVLETFAVFQRYESQMRKYQKD
jgi:tripartite-type tricarboxylate transporter receptor subunit TctC